jgi:pyrroline-5-carboxylate reductase
VTSPSAASAVELPSVAILGAGSMGRAILAGLLADHVTVTGGVRVTNRSAERARDFDNEPRVTAWVTSTDELANRHAVAGARIVVLAVKPAQIAELASEIADALEHDAILVSVAAGVTTETIEAALGGVGSVIRAMPNTPAAIRLGMTGLSAGSSASPADLDLVAKVFATVGDVLVVPESQLDALTTISGSGPAYVFYFIEQLEAAAVARGFTPDEAALLARSTFRGASEYVLASGHSPAELRRAVTSPNGTTERAIATFDAADIRSIVDAATAASLERARELAAGN